MEEHPYIVVYRTKMYRIGAQFFQALIVVQPGDMNFAATLRSVIPGNDVETNSPVLEAFAESDSFDGLVLVVGDWIDTIQSRGGVEF